MGGGRLVGKLLELDAALVEGGDADPAGGCDARNFFESFSDGTSFSDPAGGKGRLKQFKWNSAPK